LDVLAQGDISFNAFFGHGSTLVMERVL